MPDTLHYPGCGCPVPALRVTDAEVAARIARYLVCPQHGRKLLMPSAPLANDRWRKAYEDGQAHGHQDLRDVYWGAE